jgi:hypothetical protein
MRLVPVGDAISSVMIPIVLRCGLRRFSGGTIPASRRSRLTPAQLDAFIHGVFDDVTDGWQHAVKAVHVVIAEFLVPRFRQAPAP